MNPSDDLAFWQDHPSTAHHFFSIVKKSKAYRKDLFPRLNQSNPNANHRPIFREGFLKLIVKDDEWREYSVEKGWVTQTGNGYWTTTEKWEGQGYLHLSNVIDFFKYRMEYEWYATQYDINP